MSDVALFVAGCIVMALVVVALIALFYAAVLDGRTEERKSKGLEPHREAEDRSRRG